jgi:hypothetical protein
MDFTLVFTINDDANRSGYWRPRSYTPVEQEPITPRAKGATAPSEVTLAGF